MFQCAGGAGQIFRKRIRDRNVLEFTNNVRLYYGRRGVTL